MKRILIALGVVMIVGIMTLVRFNIDIYTDDHPFIVPDMTGTLFRAKQVQALWPDVTEKGLTIDFDPVQQKEAPGGGTVSIMTNFRLNKKSPLIRGGCSTLAVYSPIEPWGVSVDGKDFTECVLTGRNGGYYLYIFILPNSVFQRMFEKGITVLFWPEGEPQRWGVWLDATLPHSYNLFDSNEFSFPDLDNHPRNRINNRLTIPDYGTINFDPALFN